MQDPIMDQLNQDVALAGALRNFLASPPIITFLKACVTDAVRDELDRRTPRDLTSEIRAAVAAHLGDDTSLDRRISSLIDYSELADGIDVPSLASEFRIRDIAAEIDLPDLAHHIAVNADDLVDSIDYRALAKALVAQAKLA
jgi:hypothetical protein